MAPVITTEEDKLRIRSLVPSWFKCEAGFQFKWDGSDAVVIGWGGWRSEQIVGSVNISLTSPNGGQAGGFHSLYTTIFHPATLVTAYLYKGEW